MSPPTEIEQLEDVSKRLVALRDALRVKGELEQIEGQSKFSRDPSLMEGEDFLEKTAKWDSVDQAVKDAVKKIQAAIRFSRQASQDDYAEITNHAGGAQNNRGRQRRDGEGGQQRNGGRNN